MRLWQQSWPVLVLDLEIRKAVSYWIKNNQQGKVFRDTSTYKKQVGDIIFTE